MWAWHLPTTNAWLQPSAAGPTASTGEGRSRLPLNQAPARHSCPDLPVSAPPPPLARSVLAAGVPTCQTCKSGFYVPTGATGYESCRPCGLEGCFECVADVSGPRCTVNCADSSCIECHTSAFICTKCDSDVSGEQQRVFARCCPSCSHAPAFACALHTTRIPLPKHYLDGGACAPGSKECSASLEGCELCPPDHADECAQCATCYGLLDESACQEFSNVSTDPPPPPCFPSSYRNTKKGGSCGSVRLQLQAILSSILPARLSQATAHMLPLAVRHRPVRDLHFLLAHWREMLR